MQCVLEELFHRIPLVYGVGCLEAVNVAFSAIAQGGGNGFHAERAGGRWQVYTFNR